MPHTQNIKEQQRQRLEQPQKPLQPWQKRVLEPECNKKKHLKLHLTISHQRNRPVPHLEKFPHPVHSQKLIKRLKGA
jgi:hypothetical protein